MGRKPVAPPINYVADFETTTDPLDCRVWHWGIVDVETPEYENVIWDISIDSFFAYIENQNANIYFHNLKFDGHFIADWLMRNEYVFSVSKVKLQSGEFKSVIDDMGKWYSLTVVWKNGKTTEFRDSLKKLPMPLKRVATSFGLEMTKGEIDYDAIRPVGYQPSHGEIDYLRRDVSIIATALKYEFDAGMEKLTVASDSMAEYKRLYGEKLFKRSFPSLPLEMDAEIRLAYRGGFTYADSRYIGRRVQSGLVLDVNSLYPSVMYSSFLPYGEPKYFRGRYTETSEYSLAIFSVTFTASIRVGHIPCIQVKNNAFFSNTDYLSVIEEPTTLWVTSVDWELWNEQYDIEVQSYNGGWGFKGAYGFFDTYIDKWMEVKANTTGGKREIAKLHLNSLYGKFASNPNMTSKIITMVNDRIKLVTGEDETRPPVYTAMGAFITAYARAITVRAAQANYGTFAYADTDSLHLLTDTVPTGINVHPSDLGAWKLEYHFTEALFVRSKFYLERLADGSMHNAVAGVPEPVSELLTFDDIWDGNVLTREWMTERTGDPTRSAKLTPAVVPGGVVLTDAPYSINL